MVQRCPKQAYLERKLDIQFVINSKESIIKTITQVNTNLILVVCDIADVPLSMHIKTFSELHLSGSFCQLFSFYVIVIAPI